MNGRITGAVLVLLAAASAATAALGATFEVKTLNRGAGGAMVFEPDHLRIAPGDSVRFVPTHSSHNAASMPSLLPAGAEPFKSQISQPFVHRFAVPGLYGIQCIPHLGMGMVMLIQVGAAQAKAPALPADLPARAASRLQHQLQALK